MDLNVINNLEELYRIQKNNFKKISVDLEGENLCRNGKIIFIQIFAIELDVVYIIECNYFKKSDIKEVLGPIFNDENIKKYMFDCRCDVDALYHQYGIELKGVIDVQLYEVGYRIFFGQNNKYYHGLAKILRDYKQKLGLREYHLDIKEKISNRFREKNFQLDIHDNEVLEYLLIDILYLEKLYFIFHPNNSFFDIIENKIKNETKNRQNIWKLDNFVNNKSMAISVI